MFFDPFLDAVLLFSRVYGLERSWWWQGSKHDLMIEALNRLTGDANSRLKLMKFIHSEIWRCWILDENPVTPCFWGQKIAMMFEYKQIWRCGRVFTRDFTNLWIVDFRILEWWRFVWTGSFGQTWTWFGPRAQTIFPYASAMNLHPLEWIGPWLNKRPIEDPLMNLNFGPLPKFVNLLVIYYFNSHFLFW